MRLERLFSLSFYLALSLSAVTLAVSESYFLPRLPYCLPILLILLFLAWKQDGKWILTETAANYLGILIAVASVAWILFNIPQTEEELIAVGVPWPAGLLPHLGPLLLILLVVKLFRPKRMQDFWVIQTVGLMMVMLGCVLAYQPNFGFLLIIYLTSLLWSLAMFHLYRERNHLDQPESPLFASVAEEPRSEAVPQLLKPARILAWSVLMVGLSYGLFLVLPRSTGDQWLPQKLSTGAPAAKLIKSGMETVIDLRRVGKVELSLDEAFRVKVSDEQGQPTHPPEQQLWRVDVLDIYDAGRWMKWAQSQETLDYRGAAMPQTTQSPEPLAIFNLRYEVRPINTGDLPLAEPIDFRWVGLDPTIGDELPKVDFFVRQPGTDSITSNISSRKAHYRYGQKLAQPSQPGRLPIRYVSQSYRSDLLHRPVPAEIRDWTQQVMATLTSTQGLIVNLDEEERVLVFQQAAVARSLRNYLAFSGQFRYTLNLRRKNYDLDPTADFLLNLRQGHCERYASGLALMLRSVGIPARVVKGYRGSESNEQGWHIVRQNQAHSWVEALVRDDGEWVWLSLDGTPAEAVEETDTSEIANWLNRFFGEGRAFWHNFIMEYNTEVQTTSLQAMYEAAKNVLAKPSEPGFWMFPLVGGGIVFLLIRRWRKVRAAKPSKQSITVPPAFYATLLRVLALRFSLKPQPGQTPLEFIEGATSVLSSEGKGLCRDAVALLYRLRYAGEAVSLTEQVELKSRIEKFDTLLHSH